MTGSAMVIAVTLAKLATLGGLGIAITTSIKWFHTYDMKFTSKKGERGGRTNHEHDIDDYRQRIKSIN